MRNWFDVRAAAGKKGGGEILIYGAIGSRFWDDEAVSAKSFVTALNSLTAAGPGDIHIRINSPGGDVSDGMAIYNAIRAIKDRVYCTIEGAAYSMASVIALAGRETRMSDVAMYMVHSPSTGVYGNAKALEQALDALRVASSVLVSAYTAKTGKTEEEIAGMLEKTTFMTAAEAKEHGFVDTISEAPVDSKIAACFDTEAWQRHYCEGGPVPVALAENTTAEGGTLPTTQGAEPPKEETKTMALKSSDIKKMCPGADAEFVLAQVEASEANEAMTIGDVMTAFIAKQNAVVAAATEAATTAQAERDEALAKAEKEKPYRGVKALEDTAPDADDSGDALTEWDDKIDALKAKGKTGLQALKLLASKEPDLHQRYVAAYNAEHGRAGRTL